jgi:hypothetical protein
MFLRVAFVFITLLCCELSAETVFFMWDNEHKNPQVIKDKKLDLDRCCDVLQKYQWPTCLAHIHEISDEEKSELFSSEFEAEEKFLRKKIQEINPIYDVLFVPTVAYELFAIAKYFSGTQAPLQDFRLVTEKMQRCADGFEDMAQDTVALIQDVLHRCANTTVSVLQKRMARLAYELRTEFPFDEKVINALSKPNNQVELNTVFDGRGYSWRALFILQNNALVSKVCDLVQQQSISITDINYDFWMGFAQGTLNKIIAAVKKWESINTAFSTDNTVRAGSDMSNFSQLRVELLSDWKINPDGIVARTLMLEYDARKKNQALLFRGSERRDYTAKGLNETILLIDSPVKIESEDIQDDTLEDLIKAYTQMQKHGEGGESSFGNSFIKSISLSYGNSLFAGAFFDTLACAYTYISKSVSKVIFKKWKLTKQTHLSPAPDKAMKIKKTYAIKKAVENIENEEIDVAPDKIYLGYALFIDKRDYIKDQCNNLFSISALNTILSLCARGEFFHSRSKVAMPVIPDKPIKLEGVYLYELYDRNNFLVIQRDPLLHAQLFSEYVAQNACVIKERGVSKARQEEDEKQFKDAHKKAAKAYRVIPAIVKEDTKTKKKEEEFFDVIENLS